MSDRIALITGVTGQDGALLAELLLDQAVDRKHRLARNPEPAAAGASFV
jgi:GDP-D-mannose dehydratase